MTTPDVSLVIVSFNTKNLLSRCFDSIRSSANGITYEILVVDNGSSDGSVDYVKNEFPEVRIVESAVNLGFASANNLGFPLARGRYVVLLNSDAFLRGGALSDAVKLMDDHPKVGLAGARLIGEDGSWQPSARTFPSFWNSVVVLLGLSHRWPGSPIFGRPDLTYRDQSKEIDCDWVPGAFSIIRRVVLEEVGVFDERFFLYYEEVDLCRRIKRAGWRIAYWPQLVVIHIGGASTGMFSQKLVTRSGKQMTLWRLQAQYLYYRKHHGFLSAFLSFQFEKSFNQMRYRLNLKKSPDRAEESQVLLALIDRAWKNTSAGQTSPPRPWEGS